MPNGSNQARQPAGSYESPGPATNDELDLTRENEHNAALEKLNSFVTRYREQKITKSKVIAGILGSLEGDVEDTLGQS